MIHVNLDYGTMINSFLRQFCLFSKVHQSMDGGNYYTDDCTYSQTYTHTHVIHVYIYIFLSLTFVMVDLFISMLPLNVFLFAR